MVYYYTEITGLCCFVLLTLAILVYENKKIEKSAKQKFYFCYGIIVLSIIAEWLAVFLNGAPAATHYLHVISKFADYASTPVAGALLVEPMMPKRRSRKFIIWLLFANLFLEALSIFNGWIFYVDSENFYHHGPYHFIYQIVYIIVIVYAITGFLLYGKQYARRNLLSVAFIWLIIIGGVVLQELVNSNFRIVCITLACSVSLLYSHFMEFAFQDDEKKLALTNEAMTDKIHILASMSDMYFSMYVINLMDNTTITYAENDVLKPFFKKGQKIEDTIISVINSLVEKKDREALIKFTDLHNLPERMKDKSVISEEFLGMNVGWFIANFTTVDFDDQRKPKRVIFTIQVIDEQKKKEEKLIIQSTTDELTGLYNRRAYEDFLEYYRKESKNFSDDWVFVSLDLNHLKYANDNFGHKAGDELLCGASKCMKDAWGKYGKVYRVGGDEFIAVIQADKDKLKDAEDEFNDFQKNWHGKLVKELSVSYGIVTKKESKDMSIDEVEKLADQRLYAAKSEYYRKSGRERRRG